MRRVLLFFSLVFSITAHAQPDDTIQDTVQSKEPGKLTLNGYLDAYYTFYTRNDAEQYVPYLFNAARKNNLAINLAFIDLQYQTKYLRARLTPGFGTYMNLNYANEPGTLKNLVEGYVGLQLSSKRDIWLDVGVFGSAHTNEGPVSRDHLMYTRSFSSEYTPYYQSGLKLSIPLSERWQANFYLLNGWQVIDDNNNKKSISTQLIYRPKQNLLINWNTFVGDERNGPDPDFRTRWFTDVYGVFSINEKWDFTSCVYLGNQEYDNEPSQLWWQVNGIARYSFTQKSSLSARLEYFSDRGGVVINSVVGGGGLQVWSSGLCFNYKVHPNALFRVEGRYFRSPDSIYPDDTSVYKDSMMVVASLSAWF